MKNRSSKTALSDQMKQVADRLEKLTGGPVEPPVQGESVTLSIAKAEAQINETRASVYKALLQSSESMKKLVLERLFDSDPEMAAARYCPPIRSRSKSLDSICCALELMHRHRLVNRKAAAAWIVKKSGGLVDKKIAGVVLGLANPGYQRNQGKHRRDSPKYEELKLDALERHRAWAKYRKLATEGFSSMAFAAILLAAEYEHGDGEERNKYMARGVAAFLRELGFYQKEADGYSSLIRDEGAVAARIGWDYY